jgi:putative transposase
MIITRKIKIKPVSKSDEALLLKTSDLAKWHYNYILSNYRTEFSEGIKKYFNAMTEKKRIPELRKQYPELGILHKDVLQNNYFRLERAYKNYGSRRKLKLRAGLPRSKNLENFYSIEYSGYYKIKNNYIIFGTGKGSKYNMRFKLTEDITDSRVDQKLKRAIIVESRGNYYVTLLEDRDIVNSNKNDQVLAFDLGVKTLATGYTSNNETFKIKRIKIEKLRKLSKALDNLNSKLSTKQEGSRKYVKLNNAKHKLYEYWKNSNKDYLHKVTSSICVNRAESAIVVGDIDVHSIIDKTIYTGINRRTLQSSMRIFVDMLRYKCELHDKKFVLINEAYTSKTCSDCGNIKHELTVKDRIYNCDSCSLIMDRDENGAKNILNKYLLTVPGSGDKDSVNHIVSYLSDNNSVIMKSKNNANRSYLRTN